MGDVTREKIIEALSGLEHKGNNIVDAGLVSEVVIANGKVYFAIDVGDSEPETFEGIREEAEGIVAKLEGVESVTATLTAERQSGNATRGNGQNGAGAQHAAGGPGNGQQNQTQAQEVRGVKHIIAVASGKGGVGKSTTAVNLALGLKALGLNVGILDADVYGPSMPRLLGVNGEPQPGPTGEIIPLEAYGIKVMSMGFLVAEGTPVVWRGPMVMQALGKMLMGVDWAPLDVMVIDMPPGTGDVQLTLAQQIPLAGALIVSTPQDLALIDARKGINMFGQVNVPILGIVENMSYFLCPSCGDRSDIFGHGGAKEEAFKIGTEFLGEVPLNMGIRETSDSGRPIVAIEPESAESKAYLQITEKLWERINSQGHHSAISAPNIVIE